MFDCNRGECSEIPRNEVATVKELSFFVSLLVILAGPIKADVTVLGGLTHEITAEPGDRIDGAIEFANNGDETAYVDIYQTDYLFFADGRTIYGDPGSNPRSNAPWISYGTSRVAIPANGTAAASYEMIVPDSIQLSGSYWSVVMIEPVSDVSDPSSREKAGEVSVGVRTIVRYAVQIITNIGDSGNSSIEVTDNKLVTDNGSTFLQLDIENNGECWLSPSVWTDLYGNDGTYVGRFESGRKRVFPGCSVRHHLDLTGVANGYYTALMIVDNGDDRVFGANYEVRLE